MQTYNIQIRTKSKKYFYKTSSALGYDLLDICKKINTCGKVNDDGCGAPQP